MTWSSTVFVRAQQANQSIIQIVLLLATQMSSSTGRSGARAMKRNSGDENAPRRLEWWQWWQWQLLRHSGLIAYRAHTLTLEWKIMTKADSRDSRFESVNGLSRMDYSKTKNVQFPSRIVGLLDGFNGISKLLTFHLFVNLCVNLSILLLLSNKQA